MSLFKQIIQREIPADIVFEDEHVLCFRDISPQAPVHVLIIPKTEVENFNGIAKLKQAELAHLLLAIPVIAEILQVSASGYRIIVNNGEDAGQEVPHLHLHLLAGKPLGSMIPG